VLVSPEDQRTIMALLDLDKDTMGTEATIDAFVQAQEVMVTIAQYSQPLRTIQAVCDHLNQILALQKQVTNLEMKQFLPPSCDHTTFEQQIQQLRDEVTEAQRTSRTVRTDQDPQRELDDMTRDAREASEESRNLRTPLANALSLAARTAPTAPQQLEDRGQKFPDSPDFSGSDRTQLTGWNAQLRMVIRHKPSTFPNEQSKMRYALNRLSGLALKEILPHIRENGEVGLEGLPAFLQLLEAAFGHPDRVATAERNMLEIIQKNQEFSQYYAEFQVIGADLEHKLTG
jgi:hypothetical protein